MKKGQKWYGTLTTSATNGLIKTLCQVYDRKQSQLVLGACLYSYDTYKVCTSILNWYLN